MSKKVALCHDESSRIATIESMNPLLRSIYEDIADELSEKIQDQVMFHYRVGSLAVKVHADTQKYGESAVTKLAKCLGQDRSILYKAMAVAEKFSEAELRGLVGQVSGERWQLTWTHIQLSLPLDDKKKIVSLLQWAIDGRMTVQKLQEEYKLRIKSSPNHRAMPALATTPKSTMGGLSQMLTMGQKMVTKFDDDFRRIIFDPLDHYAAGEVTETLLGQLAESEEMLKELAQRATDRASQMTKIRQRLVKMSTHGSPKALPAAAEPAPAAPAAPAASKSGRDPKFDAKTAKPTKGRRQPVPA